MSLSGSKSTCEGSGMNPGNAEPGKGALEASLFPRDLFLLPLSVAFFRLGFGAAPPRSAPLIWDLRGGPGVVPPEVGAGAIPTSGKTGKKLGWGFKKGKKKQKSLNRLALKQR